MNLEALSRKLFSAVDTGVSALRAIARSRPGEEGRRFVELDGRRWASDLALSRQFLMRMQEAKWNRGDGGVNWRGIPNIKDPFDLALYPLLLWELKPRTVIEIGSFQGGSALWFADLLDAMRVGPFHVHSFDIDLGRVKVTDDPRITFRRCDSMVPSTIDAEVLAKAPHPWLVIEDAHVNVKAVLTHLNRSMRSGDYLIVEDTGYIREKHEALREFARVPILGSSRWIRASPTCSVTTARSTSTAICGSANVGRVVRRLRHAMLSLAELWPPRTQRFWPG